MRHSRMCTYCTHTHRRRQFHNLCSISAATTSGQPFPPSSFQRHVLCLPAVTRLTLWRAEDLTLRPPTPAAIMLQLIYGGEMRLPYMPLHFIHPTTHTQTHRHTDTHTHMHTNASPKMFAEKRELSTQVWIQQRAAISTAKYSNSQQTRTDCCSVPMNTKNRERVNRDLGYKKG